MRTRWFSCRRSGLWRTTPRGRACVDAETDDIGSSRHVTDAHLTEIRAVGRARASTRCSPQQRQERQGHIDGVSQRTADRPFSSEIGAPTPSLLGEGVACPFYHLTTIDIQSEKSVKDFEEKRHLFSSKSFCRAKDDEYFWKKFLRFAKKLYLCSRI